MFNRRFCGIHAKRYIEVVFAKRLQEEGFICPNNDLLCWYRIKDNQIVNSIVFCTAWLKLPLVIFMGYGIHPLFQKPAYTTRIEYPQKPTDIEQFREQPLMESGSANGMCFSLYSRDIHVMVPGYGGKGIYTFDELILPQMEQATSIEACYQRHKEIRLHHKYDDMETKFASISNVFVDEAIYVGDTEMYPYCVQSAERRIELLKQYHTTQPGNNDYLQSLKDWEQRRIVLLEGGREEYLRVLEKRMEMNRNDLRKMIKSLS